tara:strand:- start:1258 stop:1638 length:381 start_codon:yes stop_codon:yes gene_type:complete
MVSTLEKRLKVVSQDMRRGWQKKLAEYVGVSQPSVSDWVAGKTLAIGSEHLIKCAEFFKVTPQWMATGEDDRAYSDPESLGKLDARRVFFAEDIADLLKQIEGGDQLRRAYAAAVLAIVSVRDEPK